MTDSAEDRDEFIEIYLEESREESEHLVKLLLQLEQDPDDVETLREAFRLLHTFKGSSGMMGYERINALAHGLETKFDACRSGRERMTTETVSVALRCIDFFRDFLTRLEEGNEDEGDPTDLIKEMASVTSIATSHQDEPVVEEKGVAEPAVPRESALEETDPGESAPSKSTSGKSESQPLSASDTPPVQAESEPVESDRTAAAAPDVDAHAEVEDSEPSRVEALESARPPVPDLGPIRRAVHEVGPVRDVTVSVRLSDRIELPELKARLIVARLQAQGEVLETNPPLNQIDETTQPITLRVRLRSAMDDGILTSSIDIEGVSAVFITESASSKRVMPPIAKSEPGKEPAPETDQAETGRESVTLPKPATRVAPTRSGETIRVGIDRLDRLMNLAGELVVTNARFDQLADEMRLLFRSGGSIDAGSPLAESLLSALARNGSVDGFDDGTDTFAGDRITGIVGNDGGSEEGAALRRGWMDRGRRMAGQVSETVDQLARLSRGIQQAVLETRMVPIGPMFNRFRRTVRDIAIKQNKRVTIEVEGEMTELDKRMVDELGDPMVHLIRNAVDHGIESSEQRSRIGKPHEGLVRLRAYHQSNHVVIEIQDDGAGIDAEKVRLRALERGLASQAELNSMTDAEVYGYIWHAGFSTADQVSDLSGRGVGMDVVRDRIAALGGVVDLSSQPGLGSTVSIRLPLTLAIVNAMIVRFRNFRLAIPVTDVHEIQGLERSEIFESQGRQMIDVRGRLLPLYRLDELFEWNDFLPPPPATSANRGGLVQAVLVRHGHRSLAIEVDDVDGNSDIVIKSLDDHFSNIPGLGGACVMGDGEVCLVLDTANLGLHGSHAAPEHEAH